MQDSPRTPGQKVGIHLSRHNDVTDYPVFPPGTCSLLSKCLTRDIWEDYKDKTDKYGFSFRQVIFPGAKYTDSKIGVCAGSLHSYYAFSSLTDRIIEEYHGHKSTEHHQSLMKPELLRYPTFTSEERRWILSTRMRVSRNLTAFPLGTSITREEREKVEHLAKSVLMELSDELSGTYYPLGDMSKQNRETLLNSNLLFKEYDKYFEAAGLLRRWPEARGIFHNKAKTFLVWVNEEDHLRIISMEEGADVRSVFGRLASSLEKMEKRLEFAFDEHFGYISSCPTNLGSGLRASMHVRLPNLQKNQSLLHDIANRYHVQVRGVDGENSSTLNGPLDISNSIRLGRSEVQLAQDMCYGVKALLQAEASL